MSTIGSAHIYENRMRPGSRTACIAAIIAFIVALQLIYFTGVISSDDMGYFAPAWYAYQGGVMTPETVSQFDYHAFARFVYWKTVQVAVMFLPSQPWAIALPSLLAAAVTLIVLVMFARRHLDFAGAVLALLFYGLIPICVCNASIAVPDLVGGALAWLGVYLVAEALIVEKANRPAWRCLAGGILIAAGYTAKETVAIMIPGLMLFVLLNRTRSFWAWKRTAVLGMGAGIWLAFEALLMWYWTSDPLFHIHAVVLSQRGYTLPAIDPSWSGLIANWTDYFRWLLDPRGDYGPVGPILLLSIGYAFWKRSAITNLLLCAVLPPMIYLSIGSTEFTSYRPVVHQSRYLVPLLPGLALLASIMIGYLWQRFPRGRGLMAVMGIAVLALSLTAPNRLAGRWYFARAFNAGYRVVEECLPLNDSPIRLCAARLTLNRFYQLPKWLNCPEIEEIDRPSPVNLDQWIDRYGGAYVLTSRHDRVGHSKANHAGRTLAGESMDCLSHFELVGRREPPRDRLSSLKAQLLGRPIPSDPARAVEIWRVPTRAEWQAMNSVGTNSPRSS